MKVCFKGCVVEFLEQKKCFLDILIWHWTLIFEVNVFYSISDFILIISLSL